MTPKPASKYHALNWLIKLTENNYQTKFGVEYNDLEVDEMILIKQARKAAELAKQAAKLLKSTAIGLAAPIVEYFAPVAFNYFKRPINNYNNVSLIAA